MLKHIKTLSFFILLAFQGKAQIIDTAFYGTPDSLLTIAGSNSNLSIVNTFGNNRIISVDYDYNSLTPQGYLELFVNITMSSTYSNEYVSFMLTKFGPHHDYGLVNTLKSKDGKKLIIHSDEAFIAHLDSIELEYLQNNYIIDLSRYIKPFPINYIDTFVFSPKSKYALKGDTLINYQRDVVRFYNINTGNQIAFNDDSLVYVSKSLDNVYTEKGYLIEKIIAKNNEIRSLVRKRYYDRLTTAVPNWFYEDYLITYNTSTNQRKVDLLNSRNYDTYQDNGIYTDYRINDFIQLGDKNFTIGTYDTIFKKAAKGINQFTNSSDNIVFPVRILKRNIINQDTPFSYDMEYHNGLLFYSAQYLTSHSTDSIHVINPISGKFLFNIKTASSNMYINFLGDNLMGIAYHRNKLLVKNLNTNVFNFYIFPSFPFPKDLNQKCLGRTGTIELEDETQNSTYNFQWKNPSNLILAGTTKTSIKYQTNGTLVGDTLIMTYTTDRGLVGTNRIYYSFKPEASAPLDTVIYCNPKKKLLKAKNVNLTLNDYKWDRLIVNNRFNLFDTITVIDTGSYRLTVISKNNGCADYDTVKVNPDFTAAIGSVLPNQKLFISCKDSITNVLATSNKTRAKVYWRNPNLNNLVFANPLKTKITGSYRIVTLDTVNGCRDSSVFVNIVNKKITPNASIIGSAALITSLTCNVPSITFSGTSTTAGTIFKWLDNNRNVYTNPITITSANGFKLFVTDTVLGCTDSSQFRATILNKAKPQFINFQKQRFITCDDVGITISATTALSGQTFIEWSDINNNSYPNPFTTAAPGQYFVTAKDNVNGCVNYDTVKVTLIPTLKFTVSNDTTICRGGTASLKASYNSPLNYTWSTGATSSSINVQPTGTATYIVTGIKASNGCIGKDTVTVNIADTVAIVPLTFKPCDPVSTTGTIKINATGGIPPLKYSINNGLTFNTNNNFNNTPFGTYAIVVKDSIGCTYNSSVLLNSTSSLPIPNFIVPSNAVKGDTIVFVDITDPRPDSVKWTFPSNIELVNDTNKFSPVVVVKDIGTTVVKVTAYYPGCQVPFTRTFNFGAADTNMANPFNNNGIESVSVNPNPNNGAFDLEIKLYKKQNFAIFISNISTNFAQQLPTQFDSKYFLQNITLNTNTPGTYVIRVIAEFGAKQLKFVVN